MARIPAALVFCTVVLICVTSVQSFALRPSWGMSSPCGKLCTKVNRPRLGLGLRMGMEQIEFTIHPDGRVEEKVTGVKGQSCHEVTKEVEEALGKVTYTKPTAEAFEEEITISTQETQTVSTDGKQSQGGQGGQEGQSWGQSSWGQSKY